MNIKEALTTNDTKTEKGMDAHSTTNSAILDMFFLSGASRKIEEKDILSLWLKAYYEDKNLAYKSLFYARDIREGQGERRFFRIISRYMFLNYFNEFQKLIQFIPEYGRWDDVYYLITEQNLSDNKKSKNKLDIKKNDFIINFIIEGLNNNGFLCAKWLPRKGKLFNEIRKKLNKTPKELRKLLVDYTAKANVVEQLICANKWVDIDYSKVHAKAFNLYKNAFRRHTPEKFNEFIQKALNKEITIKTATLYPVDVIGKYVEDYFKEISKEEKDSVKAIWEQLPDYVGRKKDENYLVVADVSGSMYGEPLKVCVSLALYLSEKNTNIFKDAFITFSSKPQLQVLKGDIFEKINQLVKAEWQMTTNLEAVFDMLVSKVKEYNVPLNQFPKTILIISDMQFDEAIKNNTKTNATEMIQNKLKELGIEMPKIVYWNVRGVLNTNPAKASDKFINMVSGYSPNIMKIVLESLSKTPYELMMAVLNSKRYEKIKI